MVAGIYFIFENLDPSGTNQELILGFPSAGRCRACANDENLHSSLCTSFRTT